MFGIKENLTPWLFLILLIGSEATSVAQTIRLRRNDYQFLNANRKNKNDGSTTSTSTKIELSSSTPLGDAESLPISLIQPKIVTSIQNTRPTLLVQRTEAKVETDVAFVFSGLALALITASLAGGSVVVSSYGLHYSSATLEKLDNIDDSNQEFAIGNCLEMRTLTFKMEMSQIAFNLLFEHVTISEFVDHADQILLKDEARQESTCIADGIKDKSLTYELTDRDTFFADPVNAIGGFEQKEKETFEQLILNEKLLKRDLKLKIIKSIKIKKTKECSLLNDGGCHVCVENKRGTGFFSSSDKCSWCEKTGKCSGKPTKDCKGDSIIKHGKKEACPDNDEEKFLDFISQGNVEWKEDSKDTKTMFVGLVKYKKRRKEVLEKWSELEKKEIKEQQLLKDTFLQECNAHHDKLNHNTKKQQKEKVGTAQDSFESLAKRVKDVNGAMTGVIEKIVKNACSGNTQNGYERLIGESWEATNNDVAEQKNNLYLDTIAAVFAIIGVNNLLSVDVDILSTLGEAIAVSPKAALFLLYVVQELKIEDGYISEVVDFVRKKLNGSNKKVNPSVSEKFVGFLTLTGIITAGLAGVDSKNVVAKIIGKVGNLIAGVVGSILAAKHLFDRIMGVVAARQECKWQKVFFTCVPVFFFIYNNHVLIYFLPLPLFNSTLCVFVFFIIYNNRVFLFFYSSSF